MVIYAFGALQATILICSIWTCSVPLHPTNYDHYTNHPSAF